MKVWKIKHPNGKFSTGTTKPMFTKTGKVWTSRNYVENHLNLKYNKKETVRDFYKLNNCKIISYNLILDEREDI